MSAFCHFLLPPVPTLILPPKIWIHLKFKYIWNIFLYNYIIGIIYNSNIQPMEFSRPEFWSGVPFSKGSSQPSGGSDSKESTCNVGDLEEGMATHSSILAWRIPMDRGAWWAAVGFPGSSAGKESACNERDLGLIPVLRRSPGEGNS